MTDKQQNQAQPAPHYQQAVEIDDARLDTVAGGRRNRGDENRDKDLDELEIQR